MIQISRFVVRRVKNFGFKRIGNLPTYQVTAVEITKSRATRFIVYTVSIHYYTVEAILEDQMNNEYVKTETTNDNDYHTE